MHFRRVRLSDGWMALFHVCNQRTCTLATLCSLRRAQAPISGVLSRLIPRARIVPAVRPQDMSQVWLAVRSAV